MKPVNPNNVAVVALDCYIFSVCLRRLAFVLVSLTVLASPALAQSADAGAEPPVGLELPPAPIGLPSGSPSDKAHWLKLQLDAALGDPVFRSALVGVAVSDVESGKSLYGYNETVLFNPASNVKLFTTAAALALLGPEYRWKTALYTDGALSGGELKGRLYLKGFGDPTLQTEDLWRLVSDVAAGGVRRISGDLAVDDTFFDDVRLGPGFDQKQEDAPYRAPNGALSLNFNSVSVRVLPANADGAPARVVVDPMSNYFVVHNEVRTAQNGHTQITIELQEQPGHMELYVRGRVQLGSDGQHQQRRIVHPDFYAAYTFRELCQKRGIKMSGAVTRKDTPPQARVLGSHYSQPLGVAVRDVNKRSNNFMAEQILKTVGAEVGGRPGSWKKGVDAVAGFLERVGIAPSAYQMTNGSGLYDSNRFTPAQLVLLLRVAYHDFRYASDFIGSLGLAGADGTVSHRMSGGAAERYVRAKTGTLAGVSCLSGYAGAPGHQPLAFAIFMNNLPEVATAQARKIQDRIAEILATYLSAK